MTSYFDNQYGGEDDDNKFKGDDDDDKSSVNSDPEDEEEEEEEEEEEVVELEGGDEEEELEDDDEEEEEEEQAGGAEDDDLEEGEIAEEKTSTKTKKISAKATYQKPVYNEDDDIEDDGEIYLQKFDQSINENYVVDFHPESVLQNYDEILVMIKVVRDTDGIIVDDLHRTIPYLTKYEKARILGQRAKQINSGATPFVKIPENVIDGYIIAELELKEKRVPFIVRRPLPNGGSEYWSIKDLEDISF